MPNGQTASTPRHSRPPPGEAEKNQAAQLEALGLAAETAGVAAAAGGGIEDEATAEAGATTNGGHEGGRRRQRPLLRKAHLQ
jgi:hypothetical protein